MNGIVISVESTCDLPERIIKENGIALVNMEFSIDQSTYMTGDGKCTVKQFYDAMREGSLTRTSQVNEFSAAEHLEKILSDGKDVIHIAFSGSLSGTYDSFVKASEGLRAKYPDRKIAVINSLSACAGQGLYAVCVAEYARDNSFEDTVAYAEGIKQRVMHLFTVDDLKYLARGGRVSKATALLGNAIHMKPVMHMNYEGKLVPFKKVISRKKALLTLAENTINQFDKTSGRIYVAHADCKEEASVIVSHLEGLGAKIELMDLGMVIGSHSGPGTIAIFFLGEDRSNIK